MDYTKEKVSGVYKITSPSGMIYIGQSSNVNRRMIEHRYRAKNSNLKLYNSIKKYGFDLHDIEILFISDSAYEKDKIEQMYITSLNTIQEGLNHVDVTSITRAFTGKKHTEEVVKAIKERMKGFTPLNAIEKRKKKVYCGINNTTYGSLSDCARGLNLSQAFISMNVNGVRENKLKLKFI